MVVSFMCVLLPPLFGEGYTSVKLLAVGNSGDIIENSFFRYLPTHTWMVIVFTGCICLLKVFATSFTIYGGGNGGNFAPSLFAGGFLGYFFSMVCVALGFEHVPLTNLVIVGMAGVMSGVMYAPLTAIFLIAESSSGYDLFIPLMIVATMSYLIAKWFSPIAPDLRHLAEEGKIFTRAHDKNILSLLRIADFIEEGSIQKIDSEATLRSLIELVKEGKRNVIAVVNKEDRLEGLITLEDIRSIMFNTMLYDTVTVKQLMKAPVALIYLNDNVGDVISRFDETRARNLPVINDDKLVGFVSKSSILNQYRLLLQEYSEDGIN
jgi:CIC family chloride channel protein